MPTTDILAPAEPLPSETRRFALPDLDRHASWFMPRFRKQYPHLTERQAIGFLRSFLYDNEHLFLYQDTGVALFQSMASHSLDAQPVVWERFCWVEDPQNAAQVEAGAFFYRDAKVWTQRLGCKIMHVLENSDVPYDQVVKQLGRITTVEQKIARV